MKLRNIYYWYFTFFRILTDAILIPVTIILAYGLKFKIGWVFHNIFFIQFGKIYSHAQIEPYLGAMGLIITLWIVAFYFSGLYRRVTKSVMPEIDEIIKVIKGVSIAIIEITAVSFFFKEIPESRWVIFYSWLFGILIFSASRFIIVQVEVWLLRRGIGSYKTIVIGANAEGQDVAERIVLFPTLGLSYVGTLADEDPEKRHYHLRKRFNLLGKPEDFKEIIKKKKIKVVFVTAAIQNESYFKELIAYCCEHNLQLNILSEMAEYLSSSVNIEDFDGIAFLQYSTLTNLTFNRVLKRIFDIVFSIFLLIVLSPLLILISMIIKIVSPSAAVIYAQERVGKDQKLFKMFKFRTMIPNAEHGTGPVMVEKNDTRYIPFGNFLRKSSLDELPQLINVIKGEMSLVGPRPERPYFVEEFNKTIPYFKYRHKVKGGITGWAQINGRSVLTNRPEHKIKYDLYYIKNWTFLLDIKIILKTMLIVSLGEEAY
jgi:exopolysaccharide biosynthesis polyprenyl glycosylphosphotransferase